MRQYWQGTVSSVSDRFEAPEIELVLDYWFTLEEPEDLTRPVSEGYSYPPPPLPRRGQTYWLIDEATWKKVQNLP